MDVRALLQPLEQDLIVYEAQGFEVNPGHSLAEDVADFLVLVERSVFLKVELA